MLCVASRRRSVSGPVSPAVCGGRNTVTVRALQSHAHHSHSHSLANISSLTHTHSRTGHNLGFQWPRGRAGGTAPPSYGAESAPGHTGGCRRNRYCPGRRGASAAAPSLPRHTSTSSTTARSPVWSQNRRFGFNIAQTPLCQRKIALQKCLHTTGWKRRTAGSVDRHQNK